MTTEIAADILRMQAHDEEQRQIKTELTRKLLEASPAAANEIREKALGERREVGREEGREEGLRIAIEAFCEAAGVSIDDGRRVWLASASAAQLSARLTELRATRS